MVEEKKPFVFEYTRPVSDWFETKRVEIKPDDYLYFKIERRYGPSWWLIGMNPKHEPKYRWVDTEIGEMRDWELRRFIQWAKSGRGSKIIEIKTSGSDFDIIEEIIKLMPTGSVSQ